MNNLLQKTPLEGDYTENPENKDNNSLEDNWISLKQIFLERINALENKQKSLSEFIGTGVKDG